MAFGFGLSLPNAISTVLNSGFNPASLFADGSIGVLYDNSDFVDSATWRRNLLTYSEQFDNAAWTKSAISITPNAGIAPDGTQTADLAIPSATSNFHYVHSANTASWGTQSFTVSVYLKPSGYNWVRLFNNVIQYGADINLVTKQVVNQNVAVSSVVVEDAANGFVRVSMTFAPNVGPTYSYLMIQPSPSAVDTAVFTGDGVSGAFVWGGQLEARSSATDYQRITDFNSDFLSAFPNTTLFADATGSQPAVVNGPVGLQLDKSQGLMLGNELITNAADREFTSDTGYWTKGADWTISGGLASRTASAGNSSLTSQIAVQQNKTYEVRITATVTAGSLLFFGPTSPVSITAGTYVNHRILLHMPTGAGGFIQVTGTSTTVATIDSISIKELPGNHRYQTTATSRPTLRGTPTGANLFSAGSFDSATGWSTGGAWVISGGKASLTAGTANLNFSGFPAVVGKTYLIRYTISDYVGGSLRIEFGGANGATQSGNGLKEGYFTASSTAFINFQVLSSFTGSIDNVEVFDVSAGSVTAPYGLQEDGIDDWMQTASLNFSATDKMFVCAGVRKLTDTPYQTLVELSATTTSNNGSFFVFTTRNGSPGEAVPRYSAGLRGNSAVASYDMSTYEAPHTGVITVAFDISGATAAEEIVPRINGSTPTLTPTTAGPAGTGNFGNYPIYFGRRGGTTLPYNGLDYGCVIVGKALTPAQIAGVERWMAQRTGVTL